MRKEEIVGNQVGFGGWISGDTTQVLPRGAPPRSQQSDHISANAVAPRLVQRDPMLYLPSELPKAKIRVVSKIIPAFRIIVVILHEAIVGLIFSSARLTQCEGWGNRRRRLQGIEEGPSGRESQTVVFLRNDELSFCDRRWNIEFVDQIFDWNYIIPLAKSSSMRLW